MNKIPLTRRGAKQLEDELKRLKTVERPRIIKDIASAREHGDLKENAEYHAAREQQSFAEGRIKEISAKLSIAQVIDVAKLNPGGKIVFGATVEMIDEATGKEVTYQIVGDDEASVEDGRISINTPIARALISKEEGDVAIVNTPGGQKEYEILTIRYI